MVFNPIMIINNFSKYIPVDYDMEESKENSLVQRNFLLGKSKEQKELKRIEAFLKMPKELVKVSMYIQKNKNVFLQKQCIVVLGKQSGKKLSPQNPIIHDCEKEGFKMHENKIQENKEYEIIEEFIREEQEPENPTKLIQRDITLEEQENLENLKLADEIILILKNDILKKQGLEVSEEQIQNEERHVNFLKQDQRQQVSENLENHRIGSEEVDYPEIQNQSKEKKISNKIKNKNGEDEQTNNCLSCYDNYPTSLYCYGFVDHYPF